LVLAAMRRAAAAVNKLRRHVSTISSSALKIRLRQSTHHEFPINQCYLQNSAD
jgi:hypothetical protein